MVSKVYTLCPASACQLPHWMVCGPAHGPRLDVVQLAASSWADILVTQSVLEDSSLRKIEVTGKIWIGDLGIGLYSCFVPLSLVSLHQGGVCL